jgi:nucleotide-binding universal stress UspA family protein
VNTLEAKPTPARTLNIKKIVVAVDLSPHSEAIAAFAAQFAQAFGASIILTHTCPSESVNPFIVIETPEVFTAPERQRAAAKGALAELAQSLRETCPDCKGAVMVGDPAERVAWLAQTLNADLIVLGSSHVHLLGRLFGLDQAANILHRAPCPVLVYSENARQA